MTLDGVPANTPKPETQTTLNPRLQTLNPKPNTIKILGPFVQLEEVEEEGLPESWQRGAVLLGSPKP